MANEQMYQEQKMSKYDKEMEDELREAYEAADTDELRKIVIEGFVEKWGKSERSIIAKLSKMNIYKPKIRVSKITGGKARTKEQLVEELEAKHNRRPGSYNTLEKANKLVILMLLGER